MLMAASSSAGVTARSECGAMPMATLRAIVSHRSGVVVDREYEAALSLGRRRAAELRTAIQHGQQRQADAGAVVPRPRCDARVPPGRHSANRPARCAGSGTRRPTCSRAAGTPRIAAPRSPRRHRGSGSRGSGTSPRASARNCRPRVPARSARPAIARWKACEWRFGMPGTTRPGRRSAGSVDWGVTEQRLCRPRRCRSARGVRLCHRAVRHRPDSACRSPCHCVGHRCIAPTRMRTHPIDHGLQRVDRLDCRDRCALRRYLPCASVLHPWRHDFASRRRACRMNSV